MGSGVGGGAGDSVGGGAEPLNCSNALAATCSLYEGVGIRGPVPTPWALALSATIGACFLSQSGFVPSGSGVGSVTASILAGTGASCPDTTGGGSTGFS